MKPRVYLSAELVPSVEDELRRLFEVQDRVEGADGAVTTPMVRVDAAFFERAGPQLKIVANHAVGLDNVDVEEAARRGIAVANTPRPTSWRAPGG